jgi:monoamine oxidase
LNASTLDMKPSVSRRQFVAAAGAAVAVASTRSWAIEPDIDVVIIGAGLSGMNAAMLLAELGAKVVVLESELRPGGRCRTMDEWYLAPDLGGAQIGRDYARVLDTAAKLGVRLGPGAHINAPYAFVVGDTLIPAKDWTGSPLNPTEGVEREVPPHALGGLFVDRRTPFTTLDGWLQPEARQYDLSLAQWLERQGASPGARRIIRTSIGRPLERLSVLRMLQEATRGRIGMDRIDPEILKGRDQYEIAGLTSQHVVGGTSRLTDAMAAALGERVRYGQRVRAIHMDARGIAIRCAGGARFRARFALAALPFSVLRGIDIRPGLRGVQADAVRGMPYGNQSQVWLRVRAPYWEHDGIEASMWTDGAFNLIRQQIESDGSRHLISALAFSDNAVRLDALPHAERGRFAIAEIERIRPSTRGKLEFVGAHSWLQAPGAQGCSYQLQPGRAFDWTREMARPHQRLWLAGEHLRQLEVGMEAAMESGEQAARGLLEQLAS